MLFNPTHATAPPWAAELATGLSCLKAAAERARTAYDSASMAASGLNADVAQADEAAGTDSVFAVVVDYDGYARRQATEVLREITFAHSGLEMSLGRVWHRAAHAYAYAVSCALSELAHGHRATKATASHTVAIPAPPPIDENLSEAHRHALLRQRDVRPNSQPYGTLPWARSAKAWHAYARAADATLRELLTAPTTAEQASGR